MAGKVIEAAERFYKIRQKSEAEVLRKLRNESNNEEIRQLIEEYKRAYGIMKDKNGRWVQCLG